MIGFRLLFLAALASNAAAAAFDGYFGGTDNAEYLSWATTSGYETSLFLPSSTDPSDGAAVHWTIEEPYVNIGVAVRASGWVGFGISDNGGMTGSDMFILEAATADTDGVRDAYVDDQRFPKEDDCQDWELVTYNQEGPFLMVEVRRKLDTGDSQDLLILNDSDPSVPVQRIIAAWGDDEIMGFHGPKTGRGAIRWFADAGAPDEEAIFAKAMLDQSDETFVVEVKDYPVKRMETEYVDFCISANDLMEQGVPLDDDGTPLTLIGFEPIVTTEHVHHFVVGASPLDNNNKTDCSIGQYLDFVYLWAPGDPPLALPENVGFAMGGEGGYRSFAIQYHYDNPQLKEDVFDNSGVNFYYSKSSRQYEAGFLQVGDPMMQLYGREVGNGLAQHSFECPSGCSSDVLQGEPVTVLREVLHMHESGASMYNYHYNKDGELVRTGSAEYFDFRQQGAQVVVQEPFTIQPGDSFRTTCYYQNAPDRNRVFGLASSEEMCISYLLYYPKKQVNGMFPWICGYNVDEMMGSSCQSTYATETFLSTGEDPNSTIAERTFGEPMSQCPVGSVPAGESSGGRTLTSLQVAMMGLGLAFAIILL